MRYRADSECEVTSPKWLQDFKDAINLGSTEDAQAFLRSVLQVWHDRYRIQDRGRLRGVVRQSQAPALTSQLVEAPEVDGRCG